MPKIIIKRSLLILLTLLFSATSCSRSDKDPSVDIREAILPEVIIDEFPYGLHLTPRKFLDIIRDQANKKLKKDEQIHFRYQFPVIEKEIQEPHFSSPIPPIITQLRNVLLKDSIILASELMGLKAVYQQRDETVIFSIYNGTDEAWVEHHTKRIPDPTSKSDPFGFTVSEEQ